MKLATFCRNLRCGIFRNMVCLESERGMARMLQIITNLRQLDFRQLSEVCIQSNTEAGKRDFPDLPEHLRLARAEQEFYQYLRECFFPTVGACYALWTVGGKYVSALRLEPYEDGLLMAALETVPQQRRRGYATALVMAVKEYAAQRKLYSHVSRDNIASLAVHDACGFHRISDCARYIDGTVTAQAWTFCSRK